MGRMKGAERGWRVSRMKATRDVFELNKFLRALSVDENENLVTASERNVFRDFLPTPPFTFSLPLLGERADYLCNAVLSIYHGE
jgi:hypothetical protein